MFTRIALSVLVATLLAGASKGQDTGPVTARNLEEQPGPVVEALEWEPLGYVEQFADPTEALGWYCVIYCDLMAQHVDSLEDDQEELQQKIDNLQELIGPDLPPDLNAFYQAVISAYAETMDANQQVIDRYQLILNAFC